MTFYSALHWAAKAIKSVARAEAALERIKQLRSK